MHSHHSQDYFRELLFMLFAQRRLILLVTLLVLGMAAAVNAFWPRIYEASSTVLIRGKVVQGAIGELGNEGSKVLPTRKEDTYSELQLLSSTELAKRAAKRLAASTSDPALGKLEPAELAEMLHTRLQFDVLPATNVIQVRMRGQQPAQMVEMIDAMLEEYVRYRLAVYQPADNLEFLEEQVERLRAEIDAREAELIELIEQDNSPDPLREIEANLLIKRDLELELSALQNHVIDLEGASPAGAVAGPPELGKLIKLNDPTLNSIVARRTELQLQEGELLRTYQPGSEKMLELKRELAQNRNLLLGALAEYRRTLQSEINANMIKMGKISERLAYIERRNLELQNSQVRADRLRRDLALQQKAYEAFVERREEARLSQAFDTSNLSSHVTVMEKAWATTDPVFPRPVIIPVGLVAGLFLGITLGLIREFLDHSFKKPSDVQRISTMPVIYSLPPLRQYRLGTDEQ